MYFSFNSFPQVLSSYSTCSFFKLLLTVLKQFPLKYLYVIVTVVLESMAFTNPFVLVTSFPSQWDHSMTRQKYPSLHTRFFSLYWVLLPNGDFFFLPIFWRLFFPVELKKVEKVVLLVLFCFLLLTAFQLWSSNILVNCRAESSLFSKLSLCPCVHADWWNNEPCTQG